MANISSLYQFYPGTATLYAVIRGLDGTAWNGTAMESYSDAHWGDYAIPLSSNGGDLYSAPIPTTLPVATYIFAFYHQEDGSYASADVILDEYVAGWNGASITPIPDGSVIVDPYALTSLALVKLEIPAVTNITTYDDMLRQFINEESAKFERLTARKILNRRYKDTIRARYGKIVPRNYPVTKVERVGYGCGYFGTFSYSGPAIRATIDIDIADTVNVSTWSAAGVETTTSLPLATYPSTSGLYAAITAISGFSGSFQYNLPSDYIYRTSPVTVKDQNGSYSAQLAFASNELPHVIRSDNAIGYDGSFADLCQVAYWAGFDTVPYDIVGAVTTAVKIRYALARMPLNLRSVTQGKISYTMKESDYPEVWWLAVKNWRRMVVYGR